MATTTGYNQTPGPTSKGQLAPVHAQTSAACVLVVEDHEDTRFMLRTMLEFRGVSVVEADNGEMAIALARNVHIDLILMDGTLPLLDGFEATRRIRELISAREIPIVIISGHAQPADEAKGFAAGCNDYLVKPFPSSAIDRMLERHLPQSKAN